MDEGRLKTLSVLQTTFVQYIAYYLVLYGNHQTYRNSTAILQKFSQATFSDYLVLYGNHQTYRNSTAILQKFSQATFSETQFFV